MKHFDVLIVGGLRFPGGTSAALAHDLLALRSTSYAVGLCQLDSASLGRKTAWHKAIVAEARHGVVEVIPEDAEAKIRPPVRAWGRLYYDPWLFERHARRAFAGVWSSSATHHASAGHGNSSS